MVTEKELQGIEDVLNGEDIFPDDAVLRFLKSKVPKLILEIRTARGDSNKNSRELNQLMCQMANEFKES